ncbi:MAG: peptidylprolyl isomerase [Firmicutes bacterium]|nr:peptidylprolyl isomerase [Bacillota bacterium]
MKKIFLLLVIVLIFCVGCSNKDTSSGTIDKVSYKETNKQTNYVKIETNQGIMLAELYPDVAPLTVENFKKLVSEKYYDNTNFHRIIKDFMIQGGQNNSKKVASIKGEFTANNFENNLKHDRGILSMARTSIPNSATSQFFIVHKKSPHLDGNYASFGKLLAGYDVLDKIASVETDTNDAPTTTQKIKSIRFIEIKE